MFCGSSRTTLCGREAYEALTSFLNCRLLELTQCIITGMTPKVS